MPVRHVLPATLLLAALTGCGGGDGGNDAPTSGATCPTGGTTLRYTGGGNGSTEPASFGKTFFDNNCIVCHGPDGGFVQGQDFTSYAGIIGRIGRIDQRAASGPARTNASMPPPTAPTDPSLEERQDLGTWIACGAPP